MDKEALNDQSLKLEEKLNDCELAINNQKQQMLSLQCQLKSREEDLIINDKQTEDYKLKLKVAHDDLGRMEERLKSFSIDIGNYQSIKEDLEHKVRSVNFRLTRIYLIFRD